MKKREEGVEENEKKIRISNFLWLYRAGPALRANMEAQAQARWVMG